MDCFKNVFVFVKVDLDEYLLLMDFDDDDFCLGMLEGEVYEE